MPLKVTIPIFITGGEIESSIRKPFALSYGQIYRPQASVASSRGSWPPLPSPFN